MFLGKVCVITGGVNGIGKSIKEELTKQGAKCYVIDTVDGDHFVGDISDKETIEKFVKHVVDKEGKIDFLINNAPPIKKGIDECSYEDFELALKVGVTAPFYLTKMFLPYFNDNDSSIFIHRFRSTWCKEGNHYINSLPELELYSSASQSAFVVQSNGTWVCQDYIPFFVLEQRNANIFTAVQIEHSAAWRFEMGLCECAAPNRFYMCGGMGNDIGCGWNTVLKSGEKLSSPKVSLAVNGDNLEGVLNDMHTHRAKVLIDRKQGDINLPVIYNDWMYIVGKNNEKTILEQLGILKETGVEVLVTDAGWFCDPDVSTKKGEIWHMTGHYDYNTERFPNGIKYVADKIKEQGIKPGIWCEIECLGEGSKFYNDKEMLLMYNDKFVTDGGHRFLNFTSPKVIKYADELFERFVEWGFEYIKIDYNSDSAPGATNCGSNNPAQGLYNNRIAYDRWLKAFRGRHPQVIVENCSSGGMRLEYNSLSNADLGSVTDQNDFKVLGGMM